MGSSGVTRCARLIERKRLQEPSLLFSSVREVGENEPSERAQAELGRLLAAAGGYRVLASDGTHLGWLDHVRYEQHADRPDEVVVCSRCLLATRRRAFPFSAVAEVKRGERTVVLRGTRSASERLPAYMTAETSDLQEFYPRLDRVLIALLGEIGETIGETTSSQAGVSPLRRSVIARALPFLSKLPRLVTIHVLPSRLSLSPMANTLS